MVNMTGKWVYGVKELKVVNAWNNFLILVFFTILIYISSLLVIKRNIDWGIPAKAKQPKINSELKFLKKPLRYYEQILTQRDLFKAQSGIMPGLTEQNFSLDAEIDIAKLQLKGIVSGKQGLQAMVINIKTEQSFICQGGEKIGSFTVKEVQQNKVILEKDGQEIILRL